MPEHKTRTKILQCAIQLLGENGAEQFSASKLAAAAGISKATLFHHFRSIDDVPIEAFEVWSNDVLDIDLPATGDLYKALVKLGNHTFDVVDQQRDFLRAYFVLLNKAMFDERLRFKVASSSDRAIETLASGIRRFVESKRAANDLARTVLMQLDGASLHLLALGNEQEVRRTWKLFCRKLTK